MAALGRVAWVLLKMPSKIGREKVQLKVNELIDLPSADEQFKGYKIESVCIQSEKDHSMKLQLVADNDTGSSYLFKVQVKFELNISLGYYLHHNKLHSQTQ
jgi:hypothetical protein